jgi:hypothetical protein
MTDDNLARWELAHELPPVTTFRITEDNEELAALAAAHPEHEIWAEQPPGLDQLKYVAQRRKGTSAQPYLVVTEDLAELRDALRPEPGQAAPCGRKHIPYPG